MMRLKTTALTWMMLLGLVLPAVPAGAEETPVLKTLKDKVSYALGVDIARNFKRQGIEADPDLVMKGLKDGLSGEKLLLPEEEVRLVLAGFQHELSKRRIEALKIVAQENKKSGEAFLAENAKKDGVQTLPSGLQYKVLKAGTGKKPTETDTVECNYRGTLITGSELDKSEAGKPTALKLTAVIPGWKEALLIMPVGSKWQLFVPPHLAYGEKGGDGRIGPNATLIFELELVSIRDSEKASN